MTKEEIIAALSLEIKETDGMTYSRKEVVLKWKDEVISSVTIAYANYDE